MGTVVDRSNPEARSAFVLAVERVLDGLAPGEVVTYGEVATEAGWPGRARAVGALLAASDGRWCWWRVVTSSGRLVPGLEADQARRLRAEGVALRGGRVRPNRHDPSDPPPDWPDPS